MSRTAKLILAITAIATAMTLFNCEPPGASFDPINGEWIGTGTSDMGTFDTRMTLEKRSGDALTGEFNFIGLVGDPTNIILNPPLPVEGKISGDNVELTYTQFGNVWDPEITIVSTLVGTLDGNTLSGTTTSVASFPDAEPQTINGTFSLIRQD
jgi:hypothetical protein